MAYDWLLKRMSYDELEELEEHALNHDLSRLADAVDSELLSRVDDVADAVGNIVTTLEDVSRNRE